MNKYVSTIFVFLILLIFIACERNNNTPGYSYFPDMAYSRAFETYSENPNFEDGKSMREPVEGTVPREMIPYHYENTDEGLIRAGRELSNPLEYTDGNLLRGKDIFTLFCQQCHGVLGNGQGFLYTSKLYPYQPASLLPEQVISRPDGEIYHIISVGRNVMGSHGTLILPDDRWKIVIYIRSLQAHRGQVKSK